MNIKMIGSIVLISDAEVETESSGGIILTGDTTKGSKPALVLMVGPEATHLVSGDKVFLNWSKSMAVDVEGKAAAIVDMEHIYAVLNRS